MSNVKFKKPTTKRKRSNHKFGYVCIKNYEYFFLLLPLIPIVQLFDWLNSKYYDNLKWSDNTADKVLDHCLPKKVEYDEKTDSFYYDVNWYSTIGVPFGYRKWYQKFNYRLDNYLVNKYNPKGYTKTIDENNYFNSVVVFKKNES